MLEPSRAPLPPRTRAPFTYLVAHPPSFPHPMATEGTIHPLTHPPRHYQDTLCGSPPLSRPTSDQIPIRPIRSRCSAGRPCACWCPSAWTAQGSWRHLRHRRRLSWTARRRRPGASRCARRHPPGAPRRAARVQSAQRVQSTRRAHIGRRGYRGYRPWSRGCGDEAETTQRGTVWRRGGGGGGADLAPVHIVHMLPLLTTYCLYCLLPCPSRHRPCYLYLLLTAYYLLLTTTLPQSTSSMVAMSCATLAGLQSAPAPPPPPPPPPPP